MNFRGTISEDIRDSRPDWAPYRPATAPAGSPNVLYLLWDDNGIATWDCYGGLVQMPNMKRIADRGIRMTQFHTTALCSPTRAALLSGRNPTTVGVSSVVNTTAGFPGHHGRIPAQTALVSEVLAEQGWSTYAVGKWHLAPIEDCHAAGSRRHWPLSRGFDRYYGFLDGMTDQWYPNLVRDNHPVDPPASPEEGYHLSKDLADNAIGFLTDHRAAAPEKPWFMYFCPGAGHSPHQVAPEWADRYRGTFDTGYEHYRETVLANQQAMGLIPAGTHLSARNPYADQTSPDGQPWPVNDTVLSWDSLSEDEKRISARMAEVFAGFLSYTDAQIGRILDHLERTEQLDNTIVVIMSDNGASGEGGPHGTVDEMTKHIGGAQSAQQTLGLLDEFGGPGTQMNYSTGWAMAFNTPYKLFKRYASHDGGTADPCVVSWPRGLAARGELRTNYAHVSDITPTVYDLLGIAAPPIVKDVAQEPLEGVSFAGALQDRNRASDKHEQFYSMGGTRGIWRDGWFAGTVHPAMSFQAEGWSHFDRDRWELFHIEADRSQIRDVAADHPDKLVELTARWHELALTYKAYPLSDLSVPELVALGSVATAGTPPEQKICYRGVTASQSPIGGLFRGRSFTMRVPMRISCAGAEGVLFTQGSRSGGHALFVKNQRLHYVCSFAGQHYDVTAEEPIPLGEHVLGVRFTRSTGDDDFGVTGVAELFIDNRAVSEPTTVRMTTLDIMQTLCAGRSVAYSVSPEYNSPFPFAGGDFERVIIDFSGSGEINPADVTDLMFTRD